MAIKAKKQTYTLAEMKASLSRYIAVSAEQLRKELREQWRRQAQEEPKKIHVRS